MKFGRNLNPFHLEIQISFQYGTMIVVYIGQVISQLILIIKKYTEILLDCYMQSVNSIFLII